MVGVLGVLFDELPSGHAVSPWWEATLVLLSFAVSLGFALVLLLGGDRLLERIPLPDTPLPQGHIDLSSLLRTGVIASGLIVSALALPKLLLGLYAIFFLSVESTGNAYVATGTARPMESALELVLASVLILRSEWVVNLLEHDATAEQAGAADAAQGPRS